MPTACVLISSPCKRLPTQHHQISTAIQVSQDRLPLRLRPRRSVRHHQQIGVLLCQRIRKFARPNKLRRPQSRAQSRSLRSTRIRSWKSRLPEHNGFCKGSAREEAEHEQQKETELAAYFHGISRCAITIQRTPLTHLKT